MLLHKRQYKRLDLYNAHVGNRALSALGFVVQHAGIGTYYDGSVYKQAAANTGRYTRENGRCGLLVEGADTNVLLYSSENHATWTKDGGISSASATSIIDGKAAVKYTATNTTDTVYQDIGIFDGNTSMFMIVEQGTAAKCRIEIYDSTASASFGNIELTFSTGAVTEIGGSPLEAYSYKITDSGPNGGVTYILVVSNTTSAGNNRRVLLYPSTAAGGAYTYWHHAQLSDSNHSSSPIVTTTDPVSRDGDVVTSSTIPSFWNDNEITILSEYEKIFKGDDIHTVFASSNTAADYFLCSLAGSDNNPQTLVNVGGGGPSQALSAAVLSSGARNKVGHSHKDGYTYACGNGTASANAATAGVPAATDRLDIGQALGALYWLNGRIFSIAIKTSAFSDTELEYWT